tara:strand:+ start:20 stop:889 length:870 start_codon:yes stop_codon:yes gene_type:complete
MKIIITGPNGYIARNIIKSLKPQETVTLLTFKKTKYAFLKQFDTLRFDLKKKIPEMSCDILIHAAGITPQNNYSSKEYNSINFESLKNIIKKIEIKKKIIFFSSTDVYKNQKKSSFVKESLKINYKKISNYAKSKYNCENFLKTLDIDKYPFKKIILRLPGIVGKENHKNFISELVKDIILKKKLFYYGGSNLFNNIYHIDSLVKVVKTLMNKSIKKNYEIINIGANNPIKINQVIQILKGEANINSVHTLKKDMFTIDVTKLNKYYKPKLNTKNILKKYLKEQLIKKK